MAIWIVAAMPSRMSQNGIVETFWHNHKGAKARYKEFVSTGRYNFVYIGKVEESWPSPVD